MMKTAILTDTNSGITIEEAQQRGLYVLPMPVIIDGKDYLEGVNVTHADLYAAMRAGKDIHSSQPAPGDFIDMWNRIFAEGYDELVYIPMSSGLSGFYETACCFAGTWSGQVYVVNNRRISVTLYESVLEALRMAQQGMSAAAIKASLEVHAVDSSIYITVNTLEYLKRSGRVTPAGAAIAEILSLKPVLTIQGEKLDAYAKVRGIYTLADAFLKQDDITLIEKKDYIANPKPNGYRSLHLIVETPIFLHDKKKMMKVEVQFRTISMDWWASLEHKIRYKKDVEITPEIAQELFDCAEMSAELDRRMETIQNTVFPS